MAILQWKTLITYSSPPFYLGYHGIKWLQKLGKLSWCGVVTVNTQIMTFFLTEKNSKNVIPAELYL